MTGGPRYWNEELQRWEEGEEGTADAVAAPPAPAGWGPPGGTVPDPADAAPGPADAAPAPAGTAADVSAGTAPVAPPAAEGGGPAASPAATGPGGPPAAGGDPAAGGPGPGAPSPVDGALPATPVHPAHPGVSPSAPTLTGMRPPGAGPAPAQPPPAVPWSVPPPLPEPLPGAPVPRGDDPRGAGRRRVWAVVGGATAVGAVAGLVLTLVPGGGEGPDGRADGKAASAGVSRTSGPSAPGPREPSDGGSPTGKSPAEGTGPAEDLPAGYEPYTDPEGFTLARPAGWTRTTVPSTYGIDVVHYRSPDGEHRLQVFEVSETSPGESHGLFLSDAVAKPPGFTELSLESLDGGDFTGSRLEYLVDSIKGEPDVGTWHVVDQRFAAADGRLYAIAAYGAEADGREDERALLRTALGHFCPPRTTCGTGPGAGTD
ncbi:hypothetical protein [Streptomyces viridosporus]|uniref:hypothetical protein n=1 Tax=Streptomyces viridosporus TaxID=67581 RepID=UPI0036FFAC87